MILHLDLFFYLAYTPTEIAHQLKAAKVDILIAGNKLQDKAYRNMKINNKRAKLNHQ